MRDIVDPDGTPPADFPLGIASNGQYCKKFAGKRYYFGSVKFGWRAALRRFKLEWPYIQRGENPPGKAKGRLDPSTWEHIAKEFISREARRDSHQRMSTGHFIDIKITIEIAVTHVGRSKRIYLMKPDDWADLRHALSFRWHRARDHDGAKDKSRKWVADKTNRVGIFCLKRRIVHIRAMMKWAVRTIPGTIPNYGDEFSLPSTRSIRLARTLKHIEQRDKQGDKVWEPDDLLTVRNHLDETDPVECQLDLMLLMSVCMGYGAVDCAKLPWQMIDFKTKTIRFPRLKTGVDRIGYMVPEIEEGLLRVKDLGLKANPDEAECIVHEYKDDGGKSIGDPIRLKDLVFLRPKTGRLWVTRTIRLDSNGLPDKEIHKDGIADTLNIILKVLKLKRKGLSFGTGRHTFASHGLRCADKALVGFVMGHANSHISGWYDHPPLADLRQLAYDVAGRILLPKGNDKSVAAATGPRMRLVW